MSKNKENNRRHFLKNVSLSALSLSLLPNLLSAKGTYKVLEKKNQLNCDLTTLDLYGQGPFYTENAPSLVNNQLADPLEVGTKIIISGQVFNLECNEVIPNTEIDVWHANDAGAYDNSGYNLRGKTFSNSQGFYVFETIKPGYYLNGSSYRPSHIHFKITPPGSSTLTTQLYFEDDPYIEDDDAASVEGGIYDATERIIPLIENDDGILEGTWDIFMDGEGVVLGNEIHQLQLEKGIIYSVGPNPFSGRLSIKYGVFTESQVSLFAYNLEGKIVANLETKNLPAEKYEAVWETPDELANGVYFIALKINDLQVHYKKVVLQR